jgi:aerobic carbon-monoxide dehydrogenase small subunit
MSGINIRICVNGEWRELTVKPYERLVDSLRERLGLTGTKVGCGEGECGSCTVTIDGKAVLSCLTLAVQANGKQIKTIEGLRRGDELHPIQKAFVEEGAAQCGFCTPGMIMAAEAMLKQNPNPSEEDVRKTLANNLCRCTGYDKPVKAILAAAQNLRVSD